MEHAVYLGDNVWAQRVDHGVLKLMVADDGYVDDPFCAIYLEAEVVDALLEFLGKHTPQNIGGSLEVKP